MPSLELRDRDEDNDSLLAALDVDLASSRDLERAKVRLELASLEVDEGLSDSLLSLVGGRAGSVGSAEDLGLKRRLWCSGETRARSVAEDLQKFATSGRHGVARCSRVVRPYKGAKAHHDSNRLA